MSTVLFSSGIIFLWPFIINPSGFTIQFLKLSMHLFTAFYNGSCLEWSAESSNFALATDLKYIHTRKIFLPLSTWQYRCGLSSQIYLCCDWQRWVLLESSCNVLWITRTEKHNISENIELFSIPPQTFHKTVNKSDYQSFNKSDM